MKWVPLKYVKSGTIELLTGGWFRGDGYAPYSEFANQLGVAIPPAGTVYGFAWQRRSPGSCKAQTFGDGIASIVGKVKICQSWSYMEPGDKVWQQDETLWKPTPGGYIVMNLTRSYRWSKRDPAPPFTNRVWNEAFVIMTSAYRIG